MGLFKYVDDMADADERLLNAHIPREMLELFKEIEDIENAKERLLLSFIHEIGDAGAFQFCGGHGMRWRERLLFPLRP